MTGVHAMHSIVVRSTITVTNVPAGHRGSIHGILQTSDGGQYKNFWFRSVIKLLRNEDIRCFCPLDYIYRSLLQHTVRIQRWWS